MKEEKKLEILKLIREIDKALEIVSTLPKDLYYKHHTARLTQAKAVLVGYLSDGLHDAYEAFQKGELEEQNLVAMFPDEEEREIVRRQLEEKRRQEQ